MIDKEWCRNRILAIQHQEDFSLRELTFAIGMSINTLKRVLNANSPYEWALKTRYKVTRFINRYEK